MGLLLWGLNFDCCKIPPVFAFGALGLGACLLEPVIGLKFVASEFMYSTGIFFHCSFYYIYGIAQNVTYYYIIRTYVCMYVCMRVGM